MGNVPPPKPTPEPVVEETPEPVVEETSESVVEETPEIIKENERTDSSSELVVALNEGSVDDLISILPYLGIVIAAIIGGIVVIKIKNSKKDDELSIASVLPLGAITLILIESP